MFGSRHAIAPYLLLSLVFGCKAEPRSCQFGDLSSCPPSEVCVKSGPEKSTCSPLPAGSTPLIRFPFEPGHPVQCSGAPLSSGSGHDRPETVYALDLKTPGNAAAGTVYASLDGTALVQKDCKEGDRMCGEGLGNHVRLLNENGILVLYAHLARVDLEDGQKLHAGDPIGLEGKTGNTAERKLHFSVHRTPPRPWIEFLAEYRTRPGATPPSISFETLFCDPSITHECLRRRARVEKLPCHSGIQLRADWRGE